MMKISPSQIQQIAKLYGQNRTARPEKTQKTSMGRDAVDLSAQGKEIQALKQRIAQLPEVREDRVAELKSAIQSGTYQVSARQVAEKMVDRSLADHLINKDR